MANMNTSSTATAASSCVPCASLDASALLSESEIKASLSSSIPLWKLCESHKTSNKESSTILSISRKYTAKSFQAALDSVNAFGNIAEREGHHPDFHLTSYRDVEVVMYTHSLGGVTKNDISLARMFDEEVNIIYSPRWLREHPEAGGEQAIVK